jgi:hypothetical protein
MGVDVDSHIRIGYSNPVISTIRDLLHGPGKYEFFEKPQARKEIYLIGKGLTRYLHDKNIHQLVLIDRSARPAYIAVQEYWNTAYPDEKMPQIYFVNPQGFKSKRDVASVPVFYFLEDAINKEYRSENPSGARYQNEITRDFKESYRELMKHRNEKVMLFDACIHSGGSLTPIIRTMQQNNFLHLQVGVVHKDGRPDIPITYEVFSHEPYNLCYPFHTDRMTDKTFADVYPIVQKKKQEINWSVRLRKEIRRIMKEHLQADKSFGRRRNVIKLFEPRENSSAGPRQELIGMANFRKSK